MTEKLKMSALIPADPMRIYQSWLSTKGHSEMTGSPAKVTAVQGRPFSAWDGYISGKNLELKPGKLIVQSWRTTDFPEDAPDSHLEIELVKKGKGTLIKLSQTGIPSGQAGEYRQGWKDYYFKPMKDQYSGS
jgi:activator of HSP90 ATPase